MWSSRANAGLYVVSNVAMAHFASIVVCDPAFADVWSSWLILSRETQSAYVHISPGMPFASSRSVSKFQ